MIRIGIECESIEGDSWGVARLTYKLLEELSKRSELKNAYRFVLFFNRRVPALEFLNNPMFEKKVVGLPRWGLPSSFSLYYYLLLPLQAWFENLSAMYWPNYMLPLIAPSPSLVMLTEDVWHEMRNPRRPLRYKLGYGLFSNWAARHATKIMAISNSSKDALMELFGIRSSRIVVNELAVDTPIKTEPMSGRYILYVGQAFERRHLRETILAFEKIAREDDELRLIAIGPDKYDPPIIDELLSKVNATLSRNAITRLDHVTETELARYYTGALATAYISDLEAFGLPPLEALSYGVVPIVADKPVHREILGESAFYVSAPTPELIYEAMKSAIRNTAFREEIKESRKGIMERYSWRAHTDRFLQIMGDITA